MSDTIDPSRGRSLDLICKEHLENTAASVRVLEQLFERIDQPDEGIAVIKQMEERGDRLTAEAYRSLEAMASPEGVHVTEQFIQRLDDIIDGINNTARMIDICRPRKIEDAAHELVGLLIGMIEALREEMSHYPDNRQEDARLCREALKRDEENADLTYHNWRKKQYRVLVLPLVDEANWTEILGILERTTDAAYHVAVLLERETRHRHLHRRRNLPAA